MKISLKQKKELDKANAWFAQELSQLKRRRLEIMKRYNQKKTDLLKQQLAKKIRDS